MTKKQSCDIIYRQLKNQICECSSMVEFQPSKLVAWVRFPSLAPVRAHSSVDRVPGYEPVGRRFESSWARQQKGLLKSKVLFYYLFLNEMRIDTYFSRWSRRTIIYRQKRAERIFSKYKMHRGVSSRCILYSR